MSHSYLDFRGNHVHLRDEQVYVLMNLLVQAEESHLASDELSPLFKWWREESPKIAPGCIDIPFDSHVVNDVGIDQCQQLLADVEETLQAFGDQISGDALNQIVPSARFEYGDQAVEDYLDVVEKVRGLLEAGRGSVSA